MASLSWNAVPGCLSCSLFPHCAFPKWSLPHMHCVACAGQCINSNLYLECYGLRIWNSCQPVDAAAICPLGTFWRARLLLCKMLNHKNETPILCINQQLVAVVTTAVCLIAGFTPLSVKRRLSVWDTAQAPGSTPLVFSLPQGTMQTQHFPICCVFEKCPLFPISLRVKRVRHTCPRLGWQAHITLESL